MKKLILMIGLLLLFMVGPILTTLARGSTENHYVNITIFNSWPVSVLLESKCNFNYETQKYSFYKKIFIPKRSNRTLSVPNGLTNCEVWVLDVKLW